MDWYDGVSWTDDDGDSMMDGGGDVAFGGGDVAIGSGDEAFGGEDVYGSDLGVDGLVGSWLSSPRLDTTSTTVFSFP